MIPYSKPFLSLDKQLQLLQDRGMKITDKAKALSYLQRIGYYRLSAYWHPFRKANLDTFIGGTLFSQAVDLYVFDKKLRLLLLDALERLEVNLRVDIAHHLGAIDSCAHMKPNLLHGNFTKQIKPKTGKTKYCEWQKRYQEAVKHSKEEFVKHFEKKYKGDLPIWMAIELWDFGLLSTFFQGMKVSDKQIIADKYNIPNWELLESWLHSMNYVRNVCAHHCHIWNKPLIIHPKLPRKNEIPLLDHIINRDPSLQGRVYGVIAIIQYLLRFVNPTSTWAKRLREHCDSFPELDTVNLANAGFLDGWEKTMLFDFNS